MKRKELKQVLRLIDRMLADPRLNSDGGDRLRAAKRGLEVIGRSGRLDKRRLFRVVKTLAEVLLELRGS